MTEAPIQRAAGGVLWRRSRPGGGSADGIEVALVHRPRYDDWTLPKGKLDAGESDLAAALREIEEETGHTGAPGRHLGEVSYMKPAAGQDRPKIVRYWEIRAQRGAFTPNIEVDELRWLPLEEAVETLSREADRDILEAFGAGPVTTSVVLVVRHASAGSRAQWRGDDRLRPLDDEGRRQAAGLVPVLRPWGVTEIFSADFVRCVQTVEPFGRTIGVEVREDPLFSEQGYPSNEAHAVELVRTLADRQSAACVCSQGDVIPDLLGRLADRDGLATPSHERGRPPFKTKKGGAWALLWSDGRLAGAESLGLPAPDL